MEWPVWVDEYPKGFREHLDHLAISLKKFDRERGRYPANSELAAIARKIDTKSKELLKLVRNFHDRAGVTALDETKKTAALEFIGNQVDATEDEMEYIQIGFSPYSIQWPLLGLTYHMQFLQDALSGNDGRPGKFIERRAIERLIDLATKAGIPLGRKGYVRSVELFDALFHNAGIEHPRIRMLQDIRKQYKDNVENHT